MVHKAGDKVMVDDEKCEVVAVYGASTYVVKTPDGATRKVPAGQVREVEEVKESEVEEESGGEGSKPPGVEVETGLEEKD